MGEMNTKNIMKDPTYYARKDPAYAKNDSTHERKHPTHSRMDITSLIFEWDWRFSKLDAFNITWWPLPLELIPDKVDLTDEYEEHFILITYGEENLQLELARKLEESPPQNFFKILGNPSNVLETFFNKEAFSKFMEAHGLTQFHPLIYNYSQTSDMMFPLVMKPNRGAYGRGIKIIKSAAELLEELDLIDVKEYSLCEYIDGKIEYTFYFLFDGQNFIRNRTGKFSFENGEHVKGHNGTGRLTWITGNVEPSVPNIMSKILRITMYKGIGCANYKFQGDVPKIFEINPRVCGGMLNWRKKDLADWFHAWKKIV